MHPRGGGVSHYDGPANNNSCDHVLPVQGPQTISCSHRWALPYRDVAAPIETVRASASVAPAIKLAFEFLVLTAARSGEVRLATWEEIDLAGQVWTVPVLRMKAKREHRVPLSRRAAGILDAARAPDLAPHFGEIRNFSSLLERTHLIVGESDRGHP